MTGRAATIGLWAWSLAWAQPVVRDPGARLQQALSAEKAGRTDAAVRQFRAVIADAPPPEIEGQARLELTRIHETRGEWWEAVEQLRRLRQLAPNEPEYAYQLGVAYRSLSKWAFERVRTLAPESARMQQMLGEQHSIAGDPVKAIAAFERAAAADPKLPGSHLAMAVLYLRQNQRDQARAEIDKEIEIAPDSAVAKQVREMIAGGGH